MPWRLNARTVWIPKAASSPVSGKGMECYFRIERLNDRAMTLCYRSDRNEYVAFSRCLLSSVTFVE